jgi:hypothetical protein
MLTEEFLEPMQISQLHLADALGSVQGAAIGTGGTGTDPGIPFVETDCLRGMPGRSKKTGMQER